jgi:RNA polymerase sigma factor (sigma-70 family)
MATSNVDELGLLTQMDWAKRVARALLRDDADAADVAQEAWLAARRRPPDLARPVKPWLRGVVHNLSRMHARGEARRRHWEGETRHEQAGAVPDPERLLAQVELSKRLLQLVEGLAEPYRSTLLLRYYDDLSPAEIARRQNVAQGTVRWRLKVAMDNLRRELARRDGDDWRNALVPLAGVRAAGHAKGASMSYAIGVTAAAGVVLVTGAVLVVPARGAAPPPKTAATVAAAGCPAPPPQARPAAMQRASASMSGSLPNVAVLMPQETADMRVAQAARCFAGVKPTGESRIDLDVAVELVNGHGYPRAINVVHQEGADRFAVGPLEICLERELAGVAFPAPAEGTTVHQAVTLVISQDRVNVPEPPPVTKVDLGQDPRLPALGPAHAPVTMVMFSDFQCAFCQKAAPLVHELSARYPRELRIVFRQLPLPFHVDARRAAESALAAHAQGKFLAMYDQLFAHATDLSRAAIDGYAKTIGLDLARFDSDLDRGSFAPAVDADLAAARSLEHMATPTFVINGKVVRGARPLEDLAASIDEALAAAAQRN